MPYKSLQIENYCQTHSIRISKSFNARLVTGEFALREFWQIENFWKAFENFQKFQCMILMYADLTRNEVRQFENFCQIILDQNIHKF